MEVCSCEVRLGGNRNNTVVKPQVTPAEILCLKAIHGDDAVVNVDSSGHDDKRPHATEFMRLMERYGQKVVKALFPGAAPRLPVSLSDIEGQAVERLTDDEPIDLMQLPENKGTGE